MNDAQELKRQAMSAIANVRTVAGIGAGKLTVGISVYVAHIRQVDRQRGHPQRQLKRDAIGREHE